MPVPALPTRPLRPRWLLAWLALCVLVVQGLVPLAQARMALARDTAGWTEVCSASGARWERNDPGARPADPAAPDPAGAHAHCWACLLLTPGAAAPPPAPLAALRRAAADTAPPSPLPGAEPRPARGLPAPRAPPRLS